MIINIRGTSGSGKSTIVREVMKFYTHKEPIFVEGRKRPIGYELNRLDINPLFVVGHYETECGGCDTIAKDAMNTVHHMVREWHDVGFDVLFEGLLISAEARRMIEMHEAGLPIIVVVLNVQLETCIEGILDRRMRRGASSELGPNTVKNLESKMKGASRCLERFEEAGIKTYHVGREGALNIVKRELEL